MSLENCYPVTRIGNELTFIFISTNTSGRNAIIKSISYALMEKTGDTYYNLGFGDSSIYLDVPDDLAISNNGDMRTVLKTVVSTLEIFFNEHPRETVHISGSNSIRKNYYHKIVRDYGHLIEQKYTVRGSANNVIEAFQKEKDYDFILINLN